INAAPVAPTSGGNQTVCQASPIQTLTATATGGTITWYTDATAGTLVTNPTLNAVGTVTYYAQTANGTCSCLARTPVTLTINAAPVAPTSGGNQTVCQTSPIQTLTATATGGTITWYTDATAGTLVTNPTLSTVGTVTYYAQTANGTCFSSTRTPVTLTINAAPMAPTSGGNQTVCQVSPIQTLTATATGGTITWYTDATAGTLVTNPILNAVGTITYYAQAVNGTCSSSTRTPVTLTINAAPTANITGIMTACLTTTLNANTNAISPTYVWYKNNVIISGQTASSLIVTENGDYKVKITSSTFFCEQTSLISAVTVEDSTAPVISLAGASTTISCPEVPSFTAPTATDYCSAATVNEISDVKTLGNCVGSYSRTITWDATDESGNHSTTVSQTIIVVDNTAPTFIPPANITLNSNENCLANTNPTITGNVTSINDTCDSSPKATYIDTECFGTSETNGSINAGKGTYFPFTVSGFDDLSASNIQKIALSFETNQGKGRAEFTLVSPSGQGVILVGPYCSGGNCDDTNSNTKELYLPTFYPNSSGYPRWNNADFIQEGINQNMTPNGGTTSPNTITGLTSYVSSFENLTGPMNGTWFIYSRKQASVNGSINFNSVCLTPTFSCSSNKVITRTWTVTDACGNFSTAVQTIKIQDKTPPTASNPATISLDGCNGTFPAADITVVMDEADACSTPVVAFVSDSAAVLVGCTETTIRTYSVTDTCGNTINVTQNLIRTIDTTAPTASNPAAITIDGCNGTFPAADITVVMNEADVCSTPVVAFVNDSATVLEGCTETTIRTYSVTDACGNTINVTQNLIRTIDTTAPTASNPTAITIDGCNGTFPAADITVVMDEADACSTPVVAFLNDSATVLEGCTETTIRTYSVTDACGNTINVTQNLIRTIDTTAPTASNPAAITINGCNGTFPAADITVVMDEADACSTPVVAFVNDSAAVLVGCTETTIRTYSVTDVCGNTINVTQNLIRTIDTTAPTASNPAAITLTGCNGTFPAADITVVMDEADACSTPVVAFVNDSAAVLVGCTETTVRTYSVTDTCGNTINVTQNLIRTIDTMAPVFVEALPANVTVQCGTIPTAATLTATNNCNDVTVTYNQATTAGLCAGSYMLTRTWTAKNACGLSTIHTQIVTIEDTTAPVFVEVLPANVTIQCGAVPTAATLTATDNCSNAAVTYNQTTTAGLCAGSYTLTRTWTAKDACGLTKIHTQIVTVEDTTAPVFVEALPANVTVQCGAVPTAATLTATDNCSNAAVTYNQTTTAGLCAGSYTLTRTWTAKDACGLTTIHTQIVTVEDTTAPVFVEALPANVAVQCGAVPTAATLTATDNCSNAAVTYNQTTTAGLCAGSYTLTRTWTAKDACGLTTTHTQIVTVEDTTAPLFVEALPANVTIQCGAVPTAATLTATDNCSTAVVTYNQTTTAGLCAGSYTLTRTWTAKDACGLTKIHTQIVTVKDTTAPVFVEALPANVTVQCGAVPTAATLTATDNCSNAAVTYNQTTTAGLCAGSYTLTRTWTATDVCGNKATASQIINVIDTTGPTTTTVFNPTVNVTCNAIPAKPELLFIDNCSSVTTAIYTETIINKTDNSYSIVRKWSVADTCGNASEFIQIINVAISNTIVTINGSICNSGEITTANLRALLPVGTATNGTWIDVNNSGALQGDIFNASGLTGLNYTFEYKINNACSETIRIIMTIDTGCGGIVLACGTVLVHNAFSPNGDGINEIFVIDNIDDTICYPENTVEIYNRWGVLVFETKGYNNTDKAFKGLSEGRATISGSSGLPTGTYFYILSYTSVDNDGKILTNKKDGYLYLTK
ncbi:gliding motility-associated C-terminal domain-containing protein, partial [Flavobacterium sp. GT2P42]